MADLSDFTHALNAARVGFEVTCDWRMAKHLAALYGGLLDDEMASSISEVVFLDAYVGIEGMRSIRGIRRTLLRGDRCMPNWNVDMMLYMVSCLILSRLSSTYLAKLRSEWELLRSDTDVNMSASCMPFCGGETGPFDLNVPQLYTCMVILADSIPHIDWYSFAGWSVYRALEFKCAMFVSDSTSGSSTSPLISGDTSDFASCAVICMLAQITAAARARRRVAVLCTTQLCHGHTLNDWVHMYPMEHNVNGSTIQFASILKNEFCSLFGSYAGEEQAACFDRASVVQFSRCTDTEFASYCINGGMNSVCRHTAFLALWPSGAYDALSAQPHMEIFDCCNDTQCLKIANNFFSSAMRAYSSTTSWLTANVLFEDDWNASCDELLHLSWHPPLIVQMGGTIGWAVIYWHEGVIRMRTILQSISVLRDSGISPLLACIVIWIRLRVLISRERHGIRDENGRMPMLIARMAADNGVPSLACAH